MISFAVEFLIVNIAVLAQCVLSRDCATPPWDPRIAEHHLGFQIRRLSDVMQLFGTRKLAADAAAASRTSVRTKM